MSEYDDFKELRAVQESGTTILDDLKPIWNRHKLTIIGGIAGVIILALLLTYLFSPRQGTILYGICGSFLEQMVAYPETIHHTAVEQFPRAVRIYFTHTDPFGQYKLEHIECVFSMAPDGLVLEDILYNRRPIDPDQVKELGATMGSIVESDPDLTLPAPMPSALDSLKQDD